jgi:hypothetical protein
MRTAAFSSGRQISSRPARRVVAVSGDPQGQELLVALFGAYACDVIFIESFERAYSRVKEVTPDLIFILSGIEDVAACQLLSMLEIDADLSGIPVVTYVTGDTADECDEIASRLLSGSSSLAHAIQVN